MKSKDELRAAARRRRSALAADLPDFAATIARFAREIPLEPEAPLASYWPTGSEADPRDLAGALATLGHPILLPCVVGSDAPLLFRPWREGDALAANAFGVGEPMSHLDATRPAALLVPLLAFDARGFRLGYGGGHYDRSVASLRAHSGVLAIGIAYAGQETDSLPHESHDQPLDMAVTEHGLRRFAK